MTIRGTLEKKELNGFGYSVVFVSKTRYSTDKKGEIPAEVGDQVEFTAFDKPGKDGRAWPTIQLATFKKVTGSATAGVGSNATAVPSTNGGKSGSNVATNSGSGRDSYWSDKAAEDAKKDPRIVFQSSYERALLFARLAIDTKCFEALEKAKPTARLEVLTAFVDEQAARIFKAVYAASVPTAEVTKVTEQPKAELESDPEESWS
jgi:hypothetical protein